MRGDHRQTTHPPNRRALRHETSGAEAPLQRSARCVLLLAMLIAAPASAGIPADLIIDPGFDQGVDDWSIQPDSLGQIQWSQSLGDVEPGALSLSRSAEGAFGGIEASSRCFALEPGQPVVASVSVLDDEARGECRASLTRYTGPGCTGERTIIGGGTNPPPPPPGWRRIPFTSAPVGPYPSGRLTLSIANPGSPGTCVFDDVQIGRSLVEVPTAGVFAYFVFVLSLGLAATLTLLRSAPP